MHWRDRLEKEKGKRDIMLVHTCPWLALTDSLTSATVEAKSFQCRVNYTTHTLVHYGMLTDALTAVKNTSQDFNLGRTRNY
jgi:hypothetical protein